MIRLLRVTTFFLVFFFIATSRVYAESSYVLPYPSSMPGNLTYNFHIVFEKISEYWHFGNFGQFGYNLKMADKYLVQAKTLFEYKQYLLGHKALKKSDLHFSKIMSFLEKASGKKKNISNKTAILKEAALKHIEILEKIDVETPNVFNWQPEKALATTLYLKKDIETAVNIRKNNL